MTWSCSSGSPSSRSSTACSPRRRPARAASCSSAARPASARPRSSAVSPTAPGSPHGSSWEPAIPCRRPAPWGRCSTSPGAVGGTLERLLGDSGQPRHRVLRDILGGALERPSPHAGRVRGRPLGGRGDARPPALRGPPLRLDAAAPGGDLPGRRGRAQPSPPRRARRPRNRSLRAPPVAPLSHGGGHPAPGRGQSFRSRGAPPPHRRESLLRHRGARQRLGRDPGHGARRRAGARCPPLEGGPGRARRRGGDRGARERVAPRGSRGARRPRRR